jgi:hypothetical protein
LDDGHWNGPFASASGVHFLRVAERHPGSRPRFEDAKNWLKQEWMMAKNREIVARELASMRTNYRIDVLQPEPDS